MKKDPHNTEITQEAMAQEECMSNIVKMQEEMIFLLAALAAGISALRAAIGLAFSPGTGT